MEEIKPYLIFFYEERNIWGFLRKGCFLSSLSCTERNGDWGSPLWSRFLIARRHRLNLRSSSSNFEIIAQSTLIVFDFLFHYNKFMWLSSKSPIILHEVGANKKKYNFLMMVHYHTIGCHVLTCFNESNLLWFEMLQTMWSKCHNDPFSLAPLCSTNHRS